MAYLQVFCTLEELENWVRILSDVKMLKGLTFRPSSKIGALLTSSDQISLTDDTHHLFLFPEAAAPDRPLTMRQIEPRNWGWIYVDPGRYREVDSQKILTSSTIHGEDFEYESVHPAKYIRWLKQYLRRKKIIEDGIAIKGSNQLTQNLSYTQGAYALYQSGALWKQGLHYRVEFFPSNFNSIV